jgi:hypothetical protein
MKMTKAICRKFYKFVEKIVSRLITYEKGRFTHQTGRLTDQHTYSLLNKKTERYSTRSSKVKTKQLGIEELLNQDFRDTGLKLPRKKYTLSYETPLHQYEHNFIRICLVKIFRSNKKIKTSSRTNLRKYINALEKIK